MIGEQYWATGIQLRYLSSGRWSARLDFFDDGFCDDKSTQGTLRTRYFVHIEIALDTLKADADRLGIVFRPVLFDAPFLTYDGDGEGNDYPPPVGWREILADQAKRIGFVSYEAIKAGNDPEGMQP